MIDFILLDQNLPFMVSLAIMLMIACVEGVMTLIGLELSSIMESLMPDLDLDADADLDLDHPEPPGTGMLTKALGWLRIGQVPFLVIMIAFLTCFGLGGLFLQWMFHTGTGHLLPGIVASGMTLIGTLPLVRGITGVIARLMPKDETQAVAEKSFIGQTGIITLGRASKGKPAQARLKDRYGTTHYVMVEPDVDTDEFKQGDQVLIVKQSRAGYTAIHNSISELLQDPEQ